MTTEARSPTTLSAAWSLWALLLGVGLVMPGYFVGFLTSSKLTPRKLRDVGNVRGFVALASITSVAILAHVLFIAPWVWAAMRLLTGFAYAGLYVVSESWLNGHTGNHLHSRQQAFYIVISYLVLQLERLAERMATTAPRFVAVTQ